MPCAVPTMHACLTLLRKWAAFILRVRLFVFIALLCILTFAVTTVMLISSMISVVYLHKHCRVVVI